jgi:hypothetical protein
MEKAQAGSLAGLTEAAKAELEATHGEIVEFETDWADVAFRLPKSAEFQRCEEEMASAGGRYFAQKTLLFACRVFPNADAFEALLSKRPGLVGPLWSQLTDAVGYNAKAARKK